MKKNSEIMIFLLFSNFGDGEACSESSCMLNYKPNAYFH